MSSKVRFLVNRADLHDHDDRFPLSFSQLLRLAMRAPQHTSNQLAYSLDIGTVLHVAHRLASTQELRVEWQHCVEILPR
jgi:hypothetical protein